MPLPVPQPVIAPSPIIAVCQQIGFYGYVGGGPDQINNFQRWIDRGCNTLVDIPDWKLSPEANAAADAIWVNDANAAKLYQIRKPVGDLATDAKSPWLLAWSLPDEPDRTGSMTPDQCLSQIAAWKAAAPWVRVFLNVDGSRLLGIQQGWTDADYARVLSACDWVSCDVYPIAGWGGSIPLDTPGRAADKLWAISGGKPQLMYLEVSHQGLENLPNPMRDLTPAEFWAQANQVICRRKRGHLIGVTAFPLQVGSGFAWDVMPADVEVAWLSFVEKFNATMPPAPVNPTPVVSPSNPPPVPKSPKTIAARTAPPAAQP